MEVLMPTSFFVYMQGVFGCVVSLVTANHILDPFDFLYSDLVDQLLVAYFYVTCAFVCWWGIMMRLELTAACFVVQVIVGIVLHLTTAAPNLYHEVASMSSPGSDMFVAMFLMGFFFLIVHGIGNFIRFVADFIVAMDQRHSDT